MIVAAYRSLLHGQVNILICHIYDLLADIALVVVVGKICNFPFMKKKIFSVHMSR